MFRSTLFKKAAAVANATSAASNRKTLITSMKRTTGYSLIQCKRALEAADYNPEAATQWLADKAKAEGWSKMEALSARRAKEGYCCVVQDSNYVSMFELNCETDFVAKTPAFRKLLVDIGENILADGKNDEDKNKERIADAVYKIRENIVLNRVKVINKTNKEIGYCVHNSEVFNPHVQGGRFTAVTIGQNGKFPHNLHCTAQQVMGTNPTKVGKWNVEEFEKMRTVEELTDFDSLKSDLAVMKPDLSIESIEAMNGLELKSHFKKIDSEENRLLYQEHLIKGRFCVGKYLNETGGKVVQFHRYQLGEDLDE